MLLHIELSLSLSLRAFPQIQRLLNPGKIFLSSKCLPA